MVDDDEENERKWGEFDNDRDDIDLNLHLSANSSASFDIARRDTNESTTTELYLPTISKLPPIEYD